jgi:hypothetical protein
MFFIPTWITNVLLFVTFYLLSFQHVQLRRPNPIMNLQFAMMVFTLAMILVTTFYNRESPWLSLTLFVLSVANLFLAYRQFRMLPPLRSIE